MKKFLISLIGLIASIASAQNTPFVHRAELKTNTITVKAEGVIAAHTVTSVAEIAYVAVATDKGIVPFEQPALRVVSVTTNLLDGTALVQKPLLSAQRPKGTNAAPTKPRPVLPIKSSPSSTFRQTVK